MRVTIYFTPDGWDEDMVGVGQDERGAWIVWLKGMPDEMTADEAHELAECLQAAAREAQWRRRRQHQRRGEN
jgi:hypothetical protein